MKGFCLVFFLLYSFFALKSQNKHIIDSINTQLQMAEGVDRWQPLYDLAFEYLDIDNSKVLETIENALIIATQYGDSLKMVKSMRVRAQMLGRLFRRNDQIIQIQAAIPIAEKNHFNRELGFLLNSLGNAYMFTGQFNLALEVHLKCLDVMIEERDTTDISASLNNIGVVYYRVNNFSKCIQYFDRSISIWTPSFSKRNVGKVPKEVFPMHLNLALCYNYMGDLTKAQEKVDLVRRLQDSLSSNKSIEDLEYAQGAINYSRRNFDSARLQFVRAYELFGRKGNVRYKLESVIYLADVLIEKLLLNEAKKMLQVAQGIVEADTTFVLERQRLNMVFSKYFSKTGDASLSSKHWSLYLDSWRKTFSPQWAARMMEIEKVHLTKKYRQRFEEQEAILNLKQGLVQNQKYLNITGGAIVFGLFATLVMLAKRLTIRRRIRQMLDFKVEERTVCLNADINRMSTDFGIKITRRERSLPRIMAALEQIHTDCNEIKSECGGCIEYMQEIRRLCAKSLSRLNRTN
jgi:tetratricopeptide (TPR) repeat protein